jgi:hypothetical protein
MLLRPLPQRRAAAAVLQRRRLQGERVKREAANSSTAHGAVPQGLVMVHVLVVLHCDSVTHSFFIQCQSTGTRMYLQSRTILLLQYKLYCRRSQYHYQYRTTGTSTSTQRYHYW